MKTAYELSNAQAFILMKGDKWVGKAMFAWSRSGVCTCTFSIFDADRNLYVSDTGRAGGYGYEKKSAALADALNRAGVNDSSICKVYPGRGILEDDFPGLRIIWAS